MEKICKKNMDVQHSVEKNETAAVFFLKKPSLIFLSINQVFKYRYSRMILRNVGEVYIFEHRLCNSVL